AHPSPWVGVRCADPTRQPRTRHMFAWLTASNVLAGILLAAVQFVAALPWLWAIDPRGFSRASRNSVALSYVGAGLLLAGLVVAGFTGYKGESASLEWYGRYVYGAALNLQLIIDFALLFPHLL